MTMVVHSENCRLSSQDESLKEVTIESSSDAESDNGGGELPLFCHDFWRIALYYKYIEMTPSEVESHLIVQRRTCEELELKGRIRVSQEGVNGVLSGKCESLKIYETKISCALKEVTRDRQGEKQRKEGGMIKGINASDCIKDGDDEKIDLDIKYCELRAELPIQKQLFDHLIIKKTKNVIGLFDQSFGQEQQRQQQKFSKLEKYRRKRERKRQQQEARRQIKIDNLHGPNSEVTAQAQTQTQKQESTSPVSSPTYDKFGDEAIDERNPPPSPQPLDNMSSLYRAVMEEPLKPARHLTAKEWNEKLDTVTSSGKSSLLLDVRNVYEMKVGHFVHPSTPTLLTNTRKYSDLPKMLASNQDMKERDQIFMYCTGGVRCERVSMLVRELYPEKEIFQLEGGIQRYLETCSKEKVGDSSESHSNYFEGKNFVFDPRRTDPIHFGKTVGRCMICKKPHDDYDNGHAPCENKEARCNNCRMLILICNDCRPKYRCHGEYDNDSSDNCNDSSEQKSQRIGSCKNGSRPLLYCNVDKCIHEGSTPDPELLIAAK